MSRSKGIGSPKGYIRDGCTLIGGYVGLTAAVIKMALDDRDWEWLRGENGSYEERDFWLKVADVEVPRFNDLVERAARR